MRLAIEKSIAQIDILGNSKLLINWVNCQKKYLTLSPIMERIRELKANFSQKKNSSYLYVIKCQGGKAMCK